MSLDALIDQFPEQLPAERCFPQPFRLVAVGEAELDVRMNALAPKVPVMTVPACPALPEDELETLERQVARELALTSPVFRDLAGNPSFNNSVAGVVVATTTLYNYGWTIITVPNNTEIDGSHVPADNTLFKDIYAAREFDVRNATQFWTGFRPGLPCQTVTLSFNVLADSPGGVLGTNFSTYSVQAGIFDQCAYDLRLFVGIVGGVGGAIILASVIATIVWVILLIKESKKQHLVEDKYKAMVR